MKAPKNLKCARCGRVILEGECCKQIDKMYYHCDCYGEIEK